MRTDQNLLLNKSLLVAALLLGGLIALASICGAASVVPSAEEQKSIQQNLNEAFNAYVSQDFEKALQYFQKVLQLDPYDAAATKGVKLCRKKLQRSVMERMNEEEQKLKLTKKLVREEKWLDAIDNLKDIADHRYQQTEALKLLGEVEVIIRKKVSQSVVGSGDYLAYQGILFYMNRRYDDALRVWKEAEQISSENFKVSIYIQRVEQFHKEDAQTESDAQRKQAKTAFESGNYEESLMLWRKILERYPNDEQASLEVSKLGTLIGKKNNQSIIGEIYDRGWGFFQEEKYTESLNEWNQIVEIDPHNEVALDYIAKIEKMGITIGKSSLLQPIAKPSVPQNLVAVASATPAPSALRESALPDSKIVVPAVKYDAGIKYYNEGNYQKAVEFFNQAFRVNSDDKKAKEWLDKVVGEQSEKADMHYQQGLMSYSLGNVEDAIKAWGKALDVYPNHISTKRAMMKVKAGQ